MIHIRCCSILELYLSVIFMYCCCYCMLPGNDNTVVSPCLYEVCDIVASAGYRTSEDFLYEISYFRNIRIVIKVLQCRGYHIKCAVSVLLILYLLLVKVLSMKYNMFELVCILAIIGPRLAYLPVQWLLYC